MIDEGLLRAHRSVQKLAYASPFWSGRLMSPHRATPSLWAVERNLGLQGYGAKFEELLVVTESGARWLDDDRPHTRARAAVRVSEVAA